MLVLGFHALVPGELSCELFVAGGFGLFEGGGEEEGLDEDANVHAGAQALGDVDDDTAELDDVRGVLVSVDRRRAKSYTIVKKSCHPGGVLLGEAGEFCITVRYDIGRA